MARKPSRYSTDNLVPVTRPIHSVPYRSPRAVAPSPESGQTLLSSAYKNLRCRWNILKVVLLSIGIGILISSISMPFLLIRKHAKNESRHHGLHGVHNFIRRQEEENGHSQVVNHGLLQQDAKNIESDGQTQNNQDEKNSKSNKNEYQNNFHNQTELISQSNHEELEQNPIITINDLKQLPARVRPSTLARGTSGLPQIETPALEGAQRGTIQCDVNVDFLAYWNDPIGKRDIEFVSPFIMSTTEEKFVTFEADRGGWNNIRMSMENVVIFAATTGRTLVLPPDVPIYLLNNKDTEGKRHRGYGDFFPLHTDKMLNDGKLKVISTTEFLKISHLQSWENESEKLRVEKVADSCVYMEKADNSCFRLYEYLRRVAYIIKDGDEFTPSNQCFIFDEQIANSSTNGTFVDDETKRNIQDFCKTRKQVYYNRDMYQAPVIHFPASQKGFRLLQHFYNFIYFTDTAIGNYYKRFVRDFLHYNDEIYCASGKIILALQKEAQNKDSMVQELDSEYGGGYSAFHVRRGDLQYKRVKIDAKDWYENTKDLFPDEKEIMYIATDERDKTFFDDMKKHYQLRYLDDYWELAGLESLDPNYFGMIDTVVASRGRIFVGTWFSTFSAYITRMRGYHGMSVDYSFYGTLEDKYIMQDNTRDTLYKEKEVAWVGIDGDGKVGSPIVNTLSRGINQLNPNMTPALVGASRGHISCDVDVDALAYWNDPQGTRDLAFQSPFVGNPDNGETKYISFQPDSGGWNNIRMNLEIIIVIAAATGRTLVLPPDTPLYLLVNDSERKHRGFGEFFYLSNPEFLKKVPIISTEDFMKREGGPSGRFPIPEQIAERSMRAAKACDNRAKSDISCDPIYEYFSTINGSYVPDINSHDCIIFDEDKFHGNALSTESEEIVDKFCGEMNNVVYFDAEIQEHPIIHFKSDKQHRILAHFYLFMKFTNIEIDNYFKRFVRDYLRYNDDIYCAAGKIVNALQEEGMKRGFDIDKDGGGGYSSLHVRRGDLQFKKVKITAEEWLDNLQETWKSGEVLYIATDEKDKTFFDPIREKFDLKFLDDFWELAGLGNLDPNYFGMIDTIVASRGRVFGGTYWSTFTGYINRMRGYHGMSMKDSYYGYLEKKFVTHEWPEYAESTHFGCEWPDGWIGIDTDQSPSRDHF